MRWIVLDDCLIGDNFIRKACIQEIECEPYLFGEIYIIQCDF